MENGTNTNDLLRMVGLMAIGVGIAWAVQILGLGHGGPTLGRLVWVVAAAAVCGAGSGLVVVTASTWPEAGAVKVRA